jgi:hypothetical protein
MTGAAFRWDGGGVTLALRVQHVMGSDHACQACHTRKSLSKGLGLGMEQRLVGLHS